MDVSIGTIEGKKFMLDLGVLADSRGLITASSGAGKSWLLRVLAENSADKIQTIILDPEGEFPTLREKCDMLIVSEDGDISPSVETAGLLARRLAETGVSAVIDLYNLPGKGDPWDKRRLFVYAFVEGLMAIPKNLYHPILVIVDEAHNFAMENPSTSKTGKDLANSYFKKSIDPSILARSAIRLMMSAGRKRGIGGVLATQRISKIDKDSVADARNIFIGGINLDIDQERAGDMLGLSKRESVKLRDLQPGQFYCFGAVFNTRGVHLFQSAQVKTSHPKSGQRINTPVPAASSQMMKIAAQFQDLPKEVEQEHDETKRLQAEVAHLRRELGKKPVPQVTATETKVQIVEKPVFREGELSGLADIILAVNQIGGHISGEIKNLSESHKAFTSEAERLEKIVRDARVIQSPAPAPKAQLPKLPLLTHAPVGSQRLVFSNKQVPNSDVIFELTGPQRKILNALAWFETIGQASPLKKAVAILAGYSPNGGGFTTPLSRLNTQGLIKYESDSRMTLTAEGRGYATYPDSALSVQDIQNQVLSILDGPGKRILRPLLEVYPDAMSKVDLAAAAGYKADAGGFTTPLSRLRTMGIIDYPESGKAIAESFLFLS